MDTVNRAGNPDLNRKMPSPFSGARPESSARRYKYIQAEESQSSGGALQNIDTHKVARGLGWLSLALGAAQLLFPRGMRKVIGAPGASLAMMRIFGLREIASGAMIFVPGRSRALGP